jgi:hypothetical protein
MAIDSIKRRYITNKGNEDKNAATVLSITVYLRVQECAVCTSVSGANTSIHPHHVPKVHTQGSVCFLFNKAHTQRPSSISAMGQPCRWSRLKARVSTVARHAHEAVT